MYFVFKVQWQGRDRIISNMHVKQAKEIISGNKETVAKAMKSKMTQEGKLQISSMTTGKHDEEDQSTKQTSEVWSPEIWDAMSGKMLDHRKVDIARREEMEFFKNY